MAAPKELSFNLGIGATFTGEVQDPALAQELYKLYNAVNILAAKLDEYTGAISVNVADRPYAPPSAVNKAAQMTRFYVPAITNLLANTVVNISGAGAQAALAGTRVAHAIVLEDTVIGDYAPLALLAVRTGFVGLTRGANYYLSNSTAGAITGASGTQRIGFAVSSTELAFGFLL